MDEIFNNPESGSYNMNPNIPQTKTFSQRSNQYFPPNSSNSNFRTNNKIQDTYSNKNQSSSPYKNKVESKHIPLNYDELAESNIYEQSGNYQCLEGVSKLVKIVPKTTHDENNEEFYETWRDDETRNIISQMILKKQKNIVESINKSQIKRKVEHPTTKDDPVSLNTSSNAKKNMSAISIINEPPQKQSSVLNNSVKNEKSVKIENSQQIDLKSKNISDKNNSVIINNDVDNQPDENYEASFEVIEENISGDEAKKEAPKKTDINFDEYKEIHEKETEKLKTKVNFFESNENLLKVGNNTTNNKQTNFAETLDKNRESAQEKMEKYSIIRRGNFHII